MILLKWECHILCSGLGFITIRKYKNELEWKWTSQQATNMHILLSYIHWLLWNLASSSLLYAVESATDTYNIDPSNVRNLPKQCWCNDINKKTTVLANAMKPKYSVWLNLSMVWFLTLNEDYNESHGELFCSTRISEGIAKAETLKPMDGGFLPWFWRGSGRTQYRTCVLFTFTPWFLESIFYGNYSCFHIPTCLRFLTSNLLR